MLRVSAKENGALARRAAAGLARAGLGTGDRVVIALPAQSAPADEVAEIQAMILGLAFGALCSGIVPVMINSALPQPEQATLFADAQASMTLNTSAGLARVFTAGEGARVPELSETPLSRPMHYTSGTTGQSKGVWSGVCDEAEARQLWGDEQGQWQFYPADVTLVHGPFAHAAPLRFAMLVLLAGGSVLLPGGFKATQVALSLRDDKPTHAFVVPSHIQRLMALPGGPPPSPYRLLTHAGAACPPTLKRAIHSWAGTDRTWEFYGSTEGQFTACHGPDWEQRPGTLGQARKGRRLIIDDGVIWCEAPAWARFEYWNDPEKTRTAWRTTATGHAFSVGDLGRLDDDGFLWLEGRRDDLIISGGINVYPAQVEAILIEHPGVSEVAVFGIEDEQWGQRVAAAVVGEINPAELTQWASPRLAKYQRPKEIYHVGDLPRTQSGKIRRAELARYLGLGP